MFFGRTRRIIKILEFQSRLLQDLSVTSGSIGSPRSGAINVTAAASDVLNVLFLFTFHPEDDDKYLLDFYWPQTPTSSSRTIAEQAVRGRLKSDRFLASISGFPIHETTEISGSGATDIDPACLALFTRSFPPEVPGRGMVGIGLRESRKERPEEVIAVENLLSALMNSAIAERAIETYVREVERFATRDPLTNLYNQNAFWDLLGYETERSKRQNYKFALLVIDLDNFKSMNDSYGHEAGDIILREVSTVLKNAVRAGDIIARYAGDQFVAILPVCDEGQAYAVAGRILDNLHLHSIALPGGAVIKQNSSIGLAVFPDHAVEARDLYLLADSMMQHAKTYGKDRLSKPSEHDDVEVLKRMGDKNLMILEALANRRIIPYFQPIVNIKDRKIEAYEVLTRIVTGDKVIPASEFIECAETMGAIGKIDYQLIEHAFAKIRESGYTGTIFLNLSPKALALDEFIPTVRKLLRDYSIEPSNMVFEITERDTIKGLKVIDGHVRELRTEGFRFAIDDFGAGYSSFQYIRQFNVDFIKVDGEFIRNMRGNGTVESAIVSSIAALSRKLGIKTIAEFVESEEILRQVASAGIHYAQGYHISRPSPEIT